MFFPPGEDGLGICGWVFGAVGRVVWTFDERGIKGRGKRVE